MRFTGISTDPLGIGFSSVHGRCVRHDPDNWSCMRWLRRGGGLNPSGAAYVALTKPRGFRAPGILPTDRRDFVRAFVSFCQKLVCPCHAVPKLTDQGLAQRKEPQRRLLLLALNGRPKPVLRRIELRWPGRRRSQSGRSSARPDA